MARFVEKIEAVCVKRVAYNGVSFSEFPFSEDLPWVRIAIKSGHLCPISDKDGSTFWYVGEDHGGYALPGYWVVRDAIGDITSYDDDGFRLRFTEAVDHQDTIKDKQNRSSFDEEAKTFKGQGRHIFRPTHINADHVVEAHPIAGAEFESDGSGKVVYLGPTGESVIVPVPPGFFYRPGSVSPGDMLIRYEPTMTEPDGHLWASRKAVFEAAFQDFRQASGEVAGPRIAGLGWRAIYDAERRANAYASGLAPKTCGLTFGEALEALKAGARICRAGWNGKGMWLSLSGPLNGREIPAESFWSLHNAEFARRNGGSATVLPCITMKTATGEILMGWLASQTDMLAEDWMLVEHGGVSIAEEPRVPRFEGADSVQVVPPAA